MKVKMYFPVIPDAEVQISAAVIGQGAAGKVYKGSYAGCTVAVKVLDVPLDEADFEQEVLLLL